MRAQRKPDERSRGTGFGRVLGVREKARVKKESLRPELNWGPTG